MKVVTWNVNGIRARHAQLQDLIAAETPDVVCLQEIKAAPDQVPALIAAPEGYWCYWHGGGGYSGVALLVRSALCGDRPDFVHPSFDVEHRIVVATIGSVRVASVYVPNGGKDYDAKLRFLTSLKAWASETNVADQSLLVCGDLNVALEERDVHPKERKPNQVGTRPDERTLLADLMGTGLVDVGRALDPDNDQLFTWWAPWRNLRQRNIGWRIDYILASRPMGTKAIRSASLREFGTSDHAPVVADFD